MHLGRNGMRAGRKQLRDAGRLESSLREPESSPQASSASPDDYRVILVIDDRVRRFLQSINPSDFFSTLGMVGVRLYWYEQSQQRRRKTSSAFRKSESDGQQQLTDDRNRVADAAMLRAPTS